MLIDFGLARQFISGTVQQHTQSFTPGYAPPEQYAPIEERGEYIDVYALAATLYSLLTGQLPMPAPARLQNFTLQPPKDLNPSVSDRVNEAIMKGMALNYKFRPQSVQEWLDLLGAGIVVPTQPVISSSNTYLSAKISPTQPITSVSQISSSWECIHVIPAVSGKIAFSPKENILASVSSGGWDSNIKLWEALTGREIYSLTGHSWSVYAITFSNDGQILASGGGDGNIKLWEVVSGQEIRTLTGHSWAIYAVTFSSNRVVLASGSGDKTIKLWDLATGQEISTLTGHAESINSLAFSNNELTLASGSVDKTIKLWDLETGKEICTLIGHLESIESVTISSDGQILASASVDKTVKIWEMATGKEVFTLSHSSSVNSIAFSPDGNLLAAGDSGGNIKIWRRS